jgi:hypothetical protein
VKTPDIPGDPRPPRDSPEYTRWYHRNVAGPKAQAAKAALAEAQKHERAQAEQVKRHIKAIEAAKTAEERVHLVGETLLDAAHSEALLINAARGEVFSILERRLDSNQRELRKWFQHAQTKGRRLVLNASRQQGKSFWAVAEALTFCFLNPKAQVKYGAPSKIQTRGIVMPHIRDLLDGDFSKGVPGVPMHLRQTRATSFRTARCSPSSPATRRRPTPSPASTRTSSSSTRQAKSTTWTSSSGTSPARCS